MVAWYTNWQGKVFPGENKHRKTSNKSNVREAAVRAKTRDLTLNDTGQTKDTQGTAVFQISG